MKFLYSCVLLLAVFAACQAHSSSWGRRNATDYLLSRQTEVHYPLKKSYWNVNIDYPSAGSVGYYNITCINVIDNFRNSSGATGSLKSGGPGKKFAKINLRSQKNRGMDTTVEIWGR